MTTSTILRFKGFRGGGKTAHKPKGPGGGQFTSGSGGGAGGEEAGAGKGGGESKSERAKKAHVMVDKTIQRYAEEHNEPAFAKAIGGLSFKDNEPVDVVLGKDGVISHGIELKTVVKNANGKITMKGEALARKRTWARKNKAQFHTVVLDDSKVFNALGEGKHDESQRRILYRRGAGSFRLEKMHVCKDMAELKTLIDTPTKKLPPAAK